MKKLNLGAAAWGLCMGLLSLNAAAQVPAPTVNHNVAGWTSNRLPSTLNPDAYFCSPGSTIPGGAVASPTDRYDSALLTPSPMAFADPALHIALPAGTYPTLVQFQNLPANPAETHVDFPFTTASTAAQDVVLNQALYGLNAGTRYGAQFQVRMVLVDVANGNAEYALGGTNTVSAISSLSPDGNYFFVSNQAWPMTGAAAAASFVCGPSGKISDQGIAGTVVTPVPMKPGSPYILRAYIGLQPGAADLRGMIDDMLLYMQAVVVDAQPDGTHSFAAATGGTTPSVLANDTINSLAVPTGNFTLRQVSADPGLTLDTTSGTIAVAPGQPGTKTLTYELCPRYDQTTVPGFVSSACKTAVATVALTGAAAPPQVSVSCTPPTLVDSAGPPAVCTVRADTVVTNPLAVSLQNLAGTARFSGTCTGTTSLTIPAGSDSVTCTIVATPNTVPGDGDVVATLSIADNAALYTVGTRSASVTVRDDDAVVAPVPSLQHGVMALMGLLVAGLGALGVRRRKSA